MNRLRSLLLAGSTVMALTLAEPRASWAQTPVFDAAALGQLVQQAATGAQQLATLRNTLNVTQQQLTQLTTFYQSFAQLTNVTQFAPTLLQQSTINPLQLQNLTSMAIWLLLGAFAIYSLPVIAYSIGTGVTTSLLPVAMALAKGAGLAADLLPSSGGGGGSSAPFEGGELNLSLARAELSGGGTVAIPPSPPPALPFAGSAALPSQGA
jgi:hypothetical protein